MAAFLRSLFEEEPPDHSNSYEEFLRRFLDFDKMVELDHPEGQVFELTEASLKVPFVTIKMKKGQYVFSEQARLRFERVEFHAKGKEKKLYFIHEDENWSQIELMLWSQYLQSKSSEEQFLNIQIPVRTFRNYFSYYSYTEDAEGRLYTHTFLNKPMKTIRGRMVESGGDLRVANNFIVLPDGDMCPLPSFSVPSLAFGKKGWLGIGVRGKDSVSTGLLALIRKACSDHFGKTLNVVPLDINDSITACDGCDEATRPCVCTKNKKRIKCMSFISHLCLLHTSRDTPYGDLAAGLWVSMPDENKVAVKVEAGTVQFLVDVYADSAESP